MTHRIPEQTMPRNALKTKTSSNGPVAAVGFATPPTQPLAPPSRDLSAAPFAHRPLASPSPRGIELPPLPAVTRSTPPPPPATSNPTSGSRLAGVSAILNHPPSVDQLPFDRRRTASQRDGPPTLPPIVTSNGRPANPRAPSPSSASDRAPRRILTPLSPASISRVPTTNQPESTSMTTQQNPFATSPSPRAYTVQANSANLPPLPTPPVAAAQQRIHYGFADQHSSSRRTSINGAPYVPAPLSASASPKTVYSSYSQPGPPGPMPLSIHTSGPALADGNNTERQRPASIPISSSGGATVYQMMAIDTGAGSVQLPVDVQAASRAADEKRRRNAGASARFRQRRKEKEREASTTIARLELEAKQLADDLDFYRREREYLSNALHGLPGGEKFFPRPVSPRVRRASSLSNGGYAATNSSDSRQSPDEGRNVRRRLSNYSLPSMGHQGYGQERGWTPDPHEREPTMQNGQAPSRSQQPQTNGHQHQYSAPPQSNGTWSNYPPTEHRVVQQPQHATGR